MVTVEEIKSAIKLLPDNDYIRLRNWILEKDWEIWDQKIKQDSKEGKSDFLFNEALEANSVFNF
jgi:hypothetical protein